MTFYELWRHTLSLLGCIALGRGIGAVLLWLQRRYFPRQKEKPREIQNAGRVRLLCIRCVDCDNVFFVSAGSIEFYPTHCCYCGVPVSLEEQPEN